MELLGLGFGFIVGRNSNGEFWKGYAWVTCTWGRVEKNRVGNKWWSEGRCGLGDCNTRVFNDTSNSWSIKSCIKLLVKW